MTTLNLPDPKAEKPTFVKPSVLVRSEDPAFRCTLHGARVLSLRECLSLIFRNHTGSAVGMRLASKLLHDVAPGMNEEDQARALFTTLEAAMGAPTPELSLLSQTDEARILAVFELARRYHFHVDESKVRPERNPDLSVLTRTALDRITPHWRNLPVEWLGFVPIQKAHIGNLTVVERGVKTHVNVDPAELFARVLALRPTMLFLFHNHPSGDLTPSSSDYDLTRRVDDICRRLGIQLLSHWIVRGTGEAEVTIDSLGGRRS